MHLFFSDGTLQIAFEYHGGSLDCSVRNKVCEVLGNYKYFHICNESRRDLW